MLCGPLIRKNERRMAHPLSGGVIGFRVHASEISLYPRKLEGAKAASPSLGELQTAEGFHG